MTGNILEVKNLQKTYGDKIAVDGISFSVKKGEVFGILGPNGAGKTTTLEMIETLRPIDGGTVKLSGLDVAKDPQKVKYLIGVQLQSTSFMDKTKLTELLEQQAAAYGEKINPKQLLADVDLTDKASSYIEKLSGGQRQRFSIAAALVHNPEVFFLDEPTTGLDPQARRNIWELIQSLQAKGITVILTTHYMEEAELLCDRVAIMDEGKIVVLDSPKKLVQSLLKRGFKKNQKVEQANLEDVFIDLTGKGLKD
ncbi:ATP-binding cassette domain-containing protein [Candidatus Saccharibacteria bacterium]|nr:ATP-binding cassette domain-containing protein [Candidatus Saccharibacteria bacterium]